MVYLCKKQMEGELSMKKSIKSFISILLVIVSLISVFGCTGVFATEDFELPIDFEGGSHTHNFNVKGKVVAPTCTEKGYTIYKCACGEMTKKNYTAVISHKAGSWEITKPATFTSTGLKVQKCTMCGKVLKSETIAKLSHGQVYSVKTDDVTMYYKDSSKIPTAIDIDKGIKYTVKYVSSDSSIVSVDEKTGEIKALKKGTATITCTVQDSYKNVVKSTSTVTVKYSFVQLFIIIFLFGWIWYIK